MNRLFLLRHAKSSWAVAGQRDHERPLNDRGREAAMAIGRHLAETGPRPDRILCSTAARTRETLAGLRLADPGLPEPVYLDALYEAGGEGYLDIIRRKGGDAPSLLVIGHNPSVEVAAARLSGTEGPPRHFPTAALAILDFETVWADVGPGSGRLLRFVRPKDLGVPGDD